MVSHTLPLKKEQKKDSVRKASVSLQGFCCCKMKPGQTCIKERDSMVKQNLHKVQTRIHPPPVDATEQRPGFTGDWLPFVTTSRILLNVCLTGFWRRGTLSLEREQRFKSVERCHCYVETWKYTVALWPWKKSSTRVAYGGFVQAYGRV